MKRPPAPLLILAAIYIGYLAWLLALEFSPVVAGRLGVSAVLFFFVLRGSRVAGNILAALFAISAAIAAAGGFQLFSANPGGATMFIALSVVLALWAIYIFFSPTVRKFQDMREGQPEDVV